MKKFLKKYWFIIFVILFAIMRFCATLHLTVFEVAYASVDDLFYISTANELKQGNWQGKFGSNTLIKGITAALFLSITSRLSISYINFTSILYIISSIAVIYSLKNLIKNRGILLAIYITLLFNPVMFAEGVIQRAYRNEFVASLSLLIMSCYFYILNNKNMLTVSKKSFLHNICIGVFLGLFYNLREDSLWLFPFIIFMSIIIIVKQKINGIKIWKSVCFSLIPIIIMIGINNSIAIVNYKYYGVYRRLDFVNSPFTKTFEYMKKIDYQDTDFNESITREKLEYLCKISPSLNKYKENLIGAFDAYDSIDLEPKNGKLNNGWWSWTLRQALGSTEVYQSLTDADNYYHQVYSELKQAEENGQISLRKENYPKFAKLFFHSLVKGIQYVCSFDSIKSNIALGAQYERELDHVDKMYKEITHDRIVYSEEHIKQYGLADLEEQRAYLEKYSYVSENINNIVKIYQVVNPIIFVISVIGYIISTIDLFRRKFDKINIWFVMSALIGSAFCIIAGCSYIDVTACNGIKYTYLAGTYGPMLLFEGEAIYYLIDKVKNHKWLNSSN